MNINMKKSKVVHIITGLGDGGAEGVLSRLCHYAQGIDHVVISLTDEGKYGAILRDANITVYCLALKVTRPSPLKYIKLIQLIRSEAPDVVQTWMYHADLLGGIAAKIAGVKRVFWGVRMSSLDPVESSRITHCIVRICAFLSRWVPEKIICCAEQAMVVHSQIGYMKNKLQVISNGYDLSRFKPDHPVGMNIRKELDISSEEFIIGMVGRFDPLKDHNNLMQALAYVTESKIQFRCVLVGNGMTHSNTILVNWISEQALQDKVILLGQRKDIADIMNCLDLHVLSSKSEGFPNVIAEAMACGVPCVSTQVGDALQIIGNQESVCPAGDPKGLAKLIIFMANEWQQNKLGWQKRKNMSVKRIHDNFSVETMADAYVSIWFGEHGAYTCAD